MKQKNSQFGKEHWEFKAPPCIQKDTEKQLGAEFNARKAKNRMSTHSKINSQDN